MAKRRESKVFFAWERRPGFFVFGGRSRLRLFVLCAMGLAFILWIRHREKRAAEVRSTRASITTARGAVTAYRADHDGKCPQTLSELAFLRYARGSNFVDAWGRALRLTCPSRTNKNDFEITSDGPDGLPGGLDRVR